MPEALTEIKRRELARLREIGLSERDFIRLSESEVPEAQLAAECPVTGCVAETLADAPAPVLDEKTRTFKFSFSNEDVFPRWFGNVRLDHSPGACRLERFNNGAPLCLNHNLDDPLCQVGTVVEDSARIDADRFGRAEGRFEGDENPLAKVAFAGVRGRTRTKISIGVIFHRLVLLEESDDGPSLYLAADWEPTEASLVPVAAIDTIGVGLAAQHPLAQNPAIDVPAAAPMRAAEEGTAMTPNESTLAAGAPAVVVGDPPAAGAAQAANDPKRIGQLALQYHQEALGMKAIAEGLTFDAFKDQLLAAISARPLESTAAHGQPLGLTQRQVQDFRILKLAGYLLAPSFETQKAAGFELEACREAAKLSGIEGQDSRFTLPNEVFFVTRKAAAEAMLGRVADAHLRAEYQERLAAVSSVDGASGGYLVGRQTGTLVELLRELTVLGELGVNYIGDLRGDFSVPKQTGGLTYGYLGDEEDGTESKPAFGELDMHPSTIYGLGKITRKMLLQSSYDVEMLLRADIFAGLGSMTQREVWTGVGGPKKILGVTRWSGVGSVIIGDNGGAFTRDHAIKMETQIAAALKGQFGGDIKFVTNSKVRGQLSLTPESLTMAAAGWVWQRVPGKPGVGELLGYPAYVTGDIPSNLTRGSGSNLSAIYGGVWKHMLIGLWGPLQIDLDDSIYFKQGGRAIRGLQDIAMTIRHAGAFSVCQDAATASVQ